MPHTCVHCRRQVKALLESALYNFIVICWKSITQCNLYCKAHRACGTGYICKAVCRRAAMVVVQQYQLNLCFWEVAWWGCVVSNSRVGMLKRCLQRQIFTEVFLHHIFICASAALLTRTKRNWKECWLVYSRWTDLWKLHFGPKD